VSEAARQLLDEYRRDIDGIDLQLLALLNERTRIV
jgi:chorismate mutase